MSAATSLADLGEFGLIERLAQSLGAQPGLRLGIGDDAALFDLAPGETNVVTTDLLVEDVHFRLRTTSAFDLGHKALAVNLSDLAAMGARPLAAFVSLALPQGLPLEFVDDFYAGMRVLAQESGTAIGGGDLSKSPGPLFISLTLCGAVCHEHALLRSGARPGTELWVLGPLGLSRAGLFALEHGLAAPSALLRTHLSPKPLLKAGRALAQSGLCLAAMDVSDGLVGDLYKLCAASGVAAEIECERLPVLPVLARFCAKHELDAQDFVLHGGEDYALLLALAPGCADGPLPHFLKGATRLGRFVKGAGVFLVDAQGRRRKAPKGYDHFAKARP